ncbi:MAG: hypothetical protein JNL62_23790 [Bryobacterales bacterium]|nr:hypothetical protein [Bryobacterales bacterium]
MNIRNGTILVSLLILAGLVLFNRSTGTQPIETLKISTGYVVLFLVLTLGLEVVVLISNGTINLEDLIADDDGDASMGRFQLLIFTFVIALSLFLVVLHEQKIPDIPASVLTLLGISASTFAVSKSVDASAKPGDASTTNPAGGGGNATGSAAKPPE